MKVLVVCEHSGIVRDAFTKLGHDAMSCDLMKSDTEGKHYKGDCFDLDWSEFGLVIAHPPCTALCVAGNRHYAHTEARVKAALFVDKMWQQNPKRLCIENPVGGINYLLPLMPKPQYIQPYEFGEDASKKTGLWLRGLPKLKPTKYVPPRIVAGQKRWGNQTDSGQNNTSGSLDRSLRRSRTYQGIADAMAAQWGGQKW